jgi:hypothetical protein
MSAVAGSTQQKAVLIQRVLAHMYPSPPIPLNHFDNFSFLIAVSILSIYMSIYILSSSIVWAMQSCVRV